MLMGGGVILLLAGLFAWPIVTDKTRAWVKEWKAAGLECLNGHQNASQHIHQTVTINVDDKPETLVGDLGYVRSCMAEIHIHKGQDNYLHVESVSADKKFKLGQFFAVYRKPLEREGYTLEAKVNGEAYTGNIADLILADKQVIELNYKKTGN